MSKQRKKRNSKIHATPDAPNYQKRCIKFSLRDVQDASACGFADLPKDHKAAFAEAMHKRKAMMWADIVKVGRKQLGYEFIARDAIKPSTAALVGEASKRTEFMAFRYHQGMAMVGYRHEDIFYVLWFDHNFGNKSVYDHGR